MPVEEMVLTILLMAGLFVGVLALTSMVLSRAVKCRSIGNTGWSSKGRPCQ